MKLSISNIAWSEENDEEIYEYISKAGFDGLEIAPTRIIKENPYEHLKVAKEFSDNLKNKYGLNISSMQSIWYGKQEKIFGSFEEREYLIKYTEKSIDFAKSINCKNLVFGCPKNRIINDLKNDYKIAIEFFNKIGDYAKIQNTYFSIEPNPTIYGTNFINKTIDAIELVKDINNDGIKINLDLGTIIQNEENIEIIRENINLINHIHISEPNLEYIKNRKIHRELIETLKECQFDKYVSIEMKNQNNTEKIKEIIDYIRGIV